MLDVRAIFKGRIHHDAVELAQITVLLQKIAWVYSVPSKRVMEGQPVGQSRVDLDHFNVTLSTCGLNSGSDCVHDCPGSGTRFQDSMIRLNVGLLDHALGQRGRCREKLRGGDYLNTGFQSRLHFLDLGAGVRLPRRLRHRRGFGLRCLCRRGVRQIETLFVFALHQPAFGAGGVNFRFRDYTFQVGKRYSAGEVRSTVAPIVEHGHGYLVDFLDV